MVVAAPGWPALAGRSGDDPPIFRKSAWLGPRLTDRKRKETSMSEIRGFHAHVYYDSDSKAKAARLREMLLAKFKVEPGGFSDEPAGPHPISQCNVIFEVPEFQTVVPWLMLNRDGLDILVHPLTDSNVDDHSKNALWLGSPVPLKLEVLSPQYRQSLLPSSQRA
jgi:aromatic ring-cleaving dioxygenase